MTEATPSPQNCPKCHYDLSDLSLRRYCPMCGKKLFREPKSDRKRKPKQGETWEVPEELKGLELYAEDWKLCDAFPKLLPRWVEDCPGIDVLEEVHKAHRWELANPRRRKLLRSAFLNGWMDRAQEKASKRPHAPERPERPYGASEAPRRPLTAPKGQNGNCEISVRPGGRDEDEAELERFLREGWA